VIRVVGEFSGGTLHYQSIVDNGDSGTKSEQ